MSNHLVLQAHPLADLLQFLVLIPVVLVPLEGWNIRMLIAVQTPILSMASIILTLGINTPQGAGGANDSWCWLADNHTVF